MNCPNGCGPMVPVMTGGVPEGSLICRSCGFLQYPITSQNPEAPTTKCSRCERVGPIVKLQDGARVDDVCLYCFLFSVSQDKEAMKCFRSLCEMVRMEDSYDERLQRAQETVLNLKHENMHLRALLSQRGRPEGEIPCPDMRELWAETGMGPDTMRETITIVKRIVQAEIKSKPKSEITADMRKLVGFLGFVMPGEGSGCG